MPRSYLLTEMSPLRHNANCVYCHVDLALHDHVTECEQCAAPHHADCWQNHANKCAVFGCSGRGQIGTSGYVAAPQAVHAPVLQRSSNPLINAARSSGRVTVSSLDTQEDFRARWLKVAQGLALLVLYNLGLYFSVPFWIVTALFNQFDMTPIVDTIPIVEMILAFALYTLLMLTTLGVILRLSLVRFVRMIGNFLLTTVYFAIVWSFFLTQTYDEWLSTDIGTMIILFLPFTVSTLLVISVFSKAP